jgi:hypothetical protein
MTCHAGLPLFLDHAFLISVYLINSNKLPVDALNFVVLYTTLFHQPPDYNFIEEFDSISLI